MGFGVLVGFTPFAAFAVVEKLAGILPGLASGLAVSVVLASRSAIRHRTVDLLEAGSAVMFAGLLLVALGRHAAWSVWEVRFYVDGGLALLVFLSVLVRRPFTMQHGKRIASAAVVQSAGFRRHNGILSAAWGCAFAGLAGVDLMMTANPPCRTAAASS
ncbi:DUF3159 domain-containing protein [Pararhizobium mangrovi]|uniref:Uncharacterized protein n=1 Tax=Pararhizobium mangrovi TaxID=2590452 RepID=A0A506TZS1_9HYPH|nr:hypothetical protein [Pararhizobium mangrovi]TPW26225.1 hypothetical protein FJU11_15690 [Pararhizobium mangrovi]